MKRSRIASLLTVLACCAAFTVAIAADATTSTTTKTTTKTTSKSTSKKAGASSDKALAAIDAQIAAAHVNKQAAGWKQSLTKPTVVTFDPAHKYLATMVTNKGTMVIELKPKVAPMHVTNFIYLAKLGFFDGLKFHRVIKGFMAQGGDPAGNGSGGPGYQFSGEFDANTKHDKRGVLSTANAGPDTDGSQFFIMFRAYPSLDMKYSIFGQVVEGLETLDKFEAAANPGDGPPLEPLTITKVTVAAK